MEGIIAAFVTAGLSLIGVIITNMRTSQSIENKLTTAQAVTDAKIDMLAEDVKRHNNFAVEVPVMKQQINDITRRVGTIEDEIEVIRNAR